jgi:hypothetical protein
MPAQPNRSLQSLLLQAGWTQDEFATRINRLSGETGLLLGLDRRSVTHWLVAGRRPRPPVPELAAEALSRALGRAVTVEETGLSAARSGSAPEPPDADVPAVLRLLNDYTPDRRHAAAAVFTLGALRHAATRQARSLGTPSIARLDEGAVAGAELSLRVFSDADTAYGGGHVRAALSSILAHDIAPRIAAPGPARLTARMLKAATQLVYLCAFTCFDSRQDAMAERYYLTSLDLAKHSADTGAYAITLRAMSVQAHTLGHRREALHLAEAAESTGYRALPALHQAFLLGQLAVASAADGDRHGATSSLIAAERHLDRSTSATAITGRYHPASLAHQEAEVRTLLGDRAGATRALTISLHRRPDTERRSRALTTARLAELQLDTGHLDQAADSWLRFLADYPHLSSARANHALRTLISRVRPFASHGVARDLLARALEIRRA